MSNSLRSVLGPGVSSQALDQSVRLVSELASSVLSQSASVALP